MDVHEVLDLLLAIHGDAEQRSHATIGAIAGDKKVRRQRYALAIGSTDVRSRAVRVVGQALQLVTEEYGRIPAEAQGCIGGATAAGSLRRLQVIAQQYLLKYILCEMEVGGRRGEPE